MPNNDISPSTSTKQLCLNGPWQFRQGGNGKWLPATVPGCNFSDLVANKEISDPFYRDQEQQLQWIEKYDWHYRKAFNVDQAMSSYRDIELVMEGLDTYCNIYLNNQRIHQSQNMFIGHRVSCKQYLRVGDNELRIEFRSPINEVMPKHLNNGFTYPAENDKSDERLSVFTRKAPYHYGWDWGPRFVTSGIWRSIRLEAVNLAKIDNLYVQQTHLADDKVKLRFQVSLHNSEQFNANLNIECHNVIGLKHQIAFSANAGSQVIDVLITVDKAKLWWPNGLGEAFLYQFSVSLLNVESQVLDEKELAVGLRTIEVINEADAYGESFYLKVNGHATFMKGANYIPSDSFLDKVSSQKYQQIFADACAANMNMLRVWGGGIYESDEFYQLADQHGILIWQDFMFACSLYPADNDFIDNVKQEIEYNVKRLRNHACLALWCGNNETEMGIEFWHWPTTFNYSDELYQRLKNDYDLLFKKVLPEMVAELDPQRFYFSSSPIGFWENKSDDNRGDNHYWGVWHGEEPFSEFKNRVPRFMSEYGFQSFPIFDSVKRYSTEEDWHLESSVMKTHQKHPRGNSLIRQYMRDEYRDPKDFESFLYLSQVQQALGMKIAFEAHRSAMPFCMGTLYWQFNDCWPVASWSGIDYYGRWKALHYQAKRSFENLAVFIDGNEEQLSIAIVSDSLSSNVYQLEQKLVTTQGKVLWSSQENVDVTALSSTKVSQHDIKSIISKADLREVVFVAQLRENGTNKQTVISEALHYFVATKALNLKVPLYVVESDVIDGELNLVLNSNTLARQVYVAIPAHDGNFSDNFFDLLANVDKHIRLPINGLNEQQVSLLLEQISIMSVVDTY
ncbi:MAG: beta-mannosidase [Alteromonadaceae bacterium]|jgi:beta-mannosidase